MTAKALITLAQQKALETLLEMEEVKSADLSAVANLTRAAFAQQRWAAELKARAEQHRSKPENGTPNEPPQIPTNAQPAVASPQQQVTGAAPTVKAERRDGPAATHNPGGGSDQSTRAMSIPPVGDSLAAPDNTSAAIVTAPLRGSPRIVEMTIPFATSDSAADANVGRPRKRSTGSKFGGHGCRFLEEARPRECTSRYAPHPEPSADRFCPARRSTSVRRLRVSSQRRCRTHADAVRRRSTQLSGYTEPVNLDTPAFLRKQPD